MTTRVTALLALLVALLSLVLQCRTVTYAGATIPQRRSNVAAGDVSNITAYRDDVTILDGRARSLARAVTQILTEVTQPYV